MIASVGGENVTLANFPRKRRKRRHAAAILAEFYDSRGDEFT